MNAETHSQLANFIWSICNLLRGPYKRNEYRKVILPLTVLRRFDCLLAPTKAQVLKEHAAIKAKPENVVRSLLEKISGRPFYNLAKLDFARVLDDPNQLAPNLNAYINGFSKNVRDIMDRLLRFQKWCDAALTVTTEGRHHLQSLRCGAALFVGQQKTVLLAPQESLVVSAATFPAARSNTSSVTSSAKFSAVTAPSFDWSCSIWFIGIPFSVVPVDVIPEPLKRNVRHLAVFRQTPPVYFESTLAPDLAPPPDGSW
jgi:hypothetical protein